MTALSSKNVAKLITWMLHRVKVERVTGLRAITNYGTKAGMEETRKITVHVPADLLAAAQEETGQGVTETVRKGLELLKRARAYRELRKLRGKVKFDLSIDELRHDRR